MPNVQFYDTPISCPRRCGTYISNVHFIVFHEDVLHIELCLDELVQKLLVVVFHCGLIMCFSICHCIHIKNDAH